MSKILRASNIFLLIVVFITMTTACKSQTPTNKSLNSLDTIKASYTNITSEEGKKRLDSDKNIILLDVRTKEEYETGHIKGAILIPVDTLEKEANNKLTDKNATIFIYCRSGNRSVTAANILIDQGYKNVYNLGGINDWPYEIEK